MRTDPSSFPALIYSSLFILQIFSITHRYFFTQFLNNPLLNGVLLTGVELGSTATQVPHSLGREPQGWIIVNKNADANVWQSSKDLSKAFVTLQASADVTVDLWVF